MASGRDRIVFDRGEDAAIGLGSMNAVPKSTTPLDRLFETDEDEDDDEEPVAAKGDDGADDPEDDELTI